MPRKSISQSAPEDRPAPTDDSHTFIIKVRDDSLYPRYMSGEYVLIEPARAPESEDDVLVRFASGETMLRRFLGRRDGRIRLGTYNSQKYSERMECREREITWMYYVANRVPAHKIKHWGESAGFFFSPPLIRK